MPFCYCEPDEAMAIVFYNLVIVLYVITTHYYDIIHNLIEVHSKTKKKITTLSMNCSIYNPCSRTVSSFAKTLIISRYVITLITYICSPTKEVDHTVVENDIIIFPLTVLTMEAIVEIFRLFEVEHILNYTKLYGMIDAMICLYFCIVLVNFMSSVSVIFMILLHVFEHQRLQTLHYHHDNVDIFLRLMTVSVTLYPVLSDEYHFTSLARTVVYVINFCFYCFGWLLIEVLHEGSTKTVIYYCATTIIYSVSVLV